MPLKKALRDLRPVEIVTVVYLLLTGFYILFAFPKIEDATLHLLYRIGIIGIVFIISFFEKKYTTAALKFIRAFYILTFLGFIYSETDALNNVFSQDLDPWFAGIENSLFNGQPSILFFKLLPYDAFNELMNLAYFSYFPLILFFCFWVYYKNKAVFDKSIFIICASFFIYYIIFILLPVAGPQFFFEAPDNHNPQAFLFSKIMHFINCMAEKPTAAFPSSHVGMVCILWILCSK